MTHSGFQHLGNQRSGKRLSALPHIFLKQATKCCGYGVTGLETKGYDCVMIPGATMAANPNLRVQVPSSICGNGAGLVSATGTISKTICSKYNNSFVCQHIHHVKQYFSTPGTDPGNIVIN